MSKLFVLMKSLVIQILLFNCHVVTPQYFQYANIGPTMPTYWPTTTIYDYQPQPHYSSPTSLQLPQMPQTLPIYPSFYRNTQTSSMLTDFPSYLPKPTIYNQQRQSQGVTTSRSLPKVTQIPPTYPLFYPNLATSSKLKELPSYLPSRPIFTEEKQPQRSIKPPPLPKLASTKSDYPLFYPNEALYPKLTDTSSHLRKTSLIPSTLNLESSKLPSVDTTVLNNLAIAIQMLALNNMLNTPLRSSETKSLNSFVSKEPPMYFPNIEEDQEIIDRTRLFHDVPVISSSVTRPAMSLLPHKRNQYSYLPLEAKDVRDRFDQSQVMPNAKFVSSSSFSDPSSLLKGMMDSLPGFGSLGTISSSNTGRRLLSPYEAVRRSSANPCAKTFCCKEDLESPYSAFLAADGQNLFDN